MKQYLTLIGLVWLLTGCASHPPPTPLATMEDRRVVMDKQLEDGLARVYFFTGEGVYGIKPKEPCLFFVNGIQVGAGNYDMFVTADLEPGRYSFTWQLENTSTYFSPVPAEVELRPGDHVYLLARSIDASHPASQWFGILGALAGTKFHYVIQQIPVEGPTLVQQKQLSALNTNLKGKVR